MSSDNIFSALAKYDSTAVENYLTEAFVFLINTLLERENPVGREILNQLCVNNNEFCFEEGEDISVSTQETTPQGRPDIKVSSPNKLIYIEVKHDSPLGPQQLERYENALELEPSDAAIKRVILLTRFAVDYEGRKPYKHVRWGKVYDWLTEAGAKAKDPASIYLIDQFRFFLEEKRMSIQKVGWEYVNGVPALNNLMDIIEEAIRSASLHIDQKSAGWGYQAFYLENKEYWCGVVYSEHLFVRFDIQDKKKFNKELVEKPTYRVTETEWIHFLLPLDDIHFFSLDKDKQLEEITKFIKTAYAEAQQMRIKTGRSKKRT